MIRGKDKGFSKFRNSFISIVTHLKYCSKDKPDIRILWIELYGFCQLLFCLRIFSHPEVCKSEICITEFIPGRQLYELSEFCFSFFKLKLFEVCKPECLN